MKTYPLVDRALCLNCGTSRPLPAKADCCTNPLVMSLHAVRKGTEKAT